MLTGRCLCGAVRFEIHSALGPVIYCHCSLCRRASGTAFAANASIRKDALKIVAGRELLTEYKSTPTTYRQFCSRCGSPLFGGDDDSPNTRVRLGTLDNAGGARSIAHIFTGSKSEWFQITDSLEQIEAEPPESYCAPGK